LDSRPGLKAKLAAGQPVIGSYVTIQSPDVVELFACAGMDYAILDMQHSSPDFGMLQHMIRAADARGMSTVVRVHEHDPALILKVLELGPEGISLPGVRSVEDVKKVVDAAYYAPIGHRGACGHTRVGGYNSRRSDMPQHIARQHERLLIWALLEDAEAIEQAGAIAALQPGVSVISVGRGDLSVLLGYPGEIDHPDVVGAAVGVVAEVREKSGGRCASAIMVQRPEDIPVWRERGCLMFTYGADAILLMEAARGAVEAFRRFLPA
jgi:2-keto-3-deoxy-L-rhamnonate aldolase RhmA